MNAPAELRDVTLDDKYTLERGRVFLTGIQALVRLPMLQRERDLPPASTPPASSPAIAARRSAGSTRRCARAKKHLDAHHIVFQPGVNEDLAATAIWGTQQVDLFPGAKYDGVFGMWYGKGPGVDRCGDVFKHAQLRGHLASTAACWCCAGDDHAAKSSTLAAPERAHLQGRADAGALPGDRAGLPRPRPARLRDVALLRLLGRLQVRHRRRRELGLGRRRSRARAGRAARPTSRCRRAA